MQSAKNLAIYLNGPGSVPPSYNSLPTSKPRFIFSCTAALGQNIVPSLWASCQKQLFLPQRVMAQAVTETKELAAAIGGGFLPHRRTARSEMPRSRAMDRQDKP